jgi:hypothetical protein
LYYECPNGDRRSERGSSDDLPANQHSQYSSLCGCSIHWRQGARSEFVSIVLPLALHHLRRYVVTNHSIAVVDHGDIADDAMTTAVH